VTAYVDLIAEYGFPIVATVGLIYMLYFIWQFITFKIKKRLSEAHTTLIKLVDRIRMLDNDLIRLQQKLDTVIELRELKEEENADNRKNKTMEDLAERAKKN